MSFSVEVFGDQSVRQYLSNEYFDVSVDTLYFCRFGISADSYLLSRSDLCLIKMHNTLSSRRIYLTMFILEVTKQCVALWFYNFQYWKFCRNFSAENQEKFRFERRTVIITVTDIEQPNGCGFILYSF